VASEPIYAVRPEHRLMGVAAPAESNLALSQPELARGAGRRAQSRHGFSRTTTAQRRCKGHGLWWKAMRAASLEKISSPDDAPRRMHPGAWSGSYVRGRLGGRSVVNDARSIDFACLRCATGERLFSPRGRFESDGRGAGMFSWTHRKLMTLVHCSALHGLRAITQRLVRRLYEDDRLTAG
jgi:hypothetical protein